ncbi:MAG: HlyD family efflux transporter periplasmic adaptor subunit [bacterium]
MKSGHLTAPGLAVAITTLLALASCSGEKPEAGGSGFIEATEATVSSEVAGQIVAMRVDEGSVVAPGDTLADTDTVATMLRLGQAKSGREAADKRVKMAAISVEQASYNSELARKEFDRAKALLESGSANQQRYDQVETAYRQAVLAGKQADAAYESARADLARAEADVSLLAKQLGDCFPTSPLSGVVVTRFVRAGEWVSVGKSLLRIAKLDTVWVKVYVPATDLARISVGGRAVVDPEDGSGRTLGGVVTWIADEAEFTPKNVQTKAARADLVYAVKVTIPNAAGVLKIGMPVSVRIE